MKDPRAVEGACARHGGAVFVTATLVALAALLVLGKTVGGWADRTGAFIVAVVVGWLALGLALELAVRVGSWLRRVVLGSASLVVSRFVHRLELSGVAERHPWLVGRVSRRTSLLRWSGLYLIVTVFFATVFLGMFACVALDLTTSSVVVGLDARISALLRGFRSPLVTRILWVATALGDLRVFAPLTVLAVVVLSMRGGMREAAVLGGAMTSGQVVVSVVKHVAERPRPPAEFALIRLPDSFSFPSGHSFASMLLFLLVALFVARNARNVHAKLWTVTGAAGAVILVGLSRVYLGVHWASDVLASWSLAVAWATPWVGAYLMLERYSGPGGQGRSFATAPVRTLVTVAAIWLAAIAVVAGAMADPLLRTAVAPPRTRSLEFEEGDHGLPLLTQGAVSDIPAFSERLDGTRQQPIGIVFLGTRDDLLCAFGSAGWEIADKPSPVTLWRTLLATRADRAYPTAPVKPSFLGGSVQSVAFEKPDGVATVRRRLCVRLCRLPFTVEAREVWAVAVSREPGFENGSAVRRPARRAVSDTDAERELVVSELKRTGRVEESGQVRVTDLRTDTSARGAPVPAKATAVVLVGQSLGRSGGF